MDCNKTFMILDRIDTILGLAGFVVSVLSFAKIKNVEKSLMKQKEKILFNKSYKQFCKEIDNNLTIVRQDGIKGAYQSILSLCDKISRYIGGVEKKERKELNDHIKSIKKAYETNPDDANEKIELELNSIRNLLESVGVKNGL